MRKKILAVVLSLTIAVAFMPAMAFATEVPAPAISIAPVADQVYTNVNLDAQVDNYSVDATTGKVTFGTVPGWAKGSGLSFAVNVSNDAAKTYDVDATMTVAAEGMKFFIEKEGTFYDLSKAQAIGKLDAPTSVTVYPVMASYKTADITANIAVTANTDTAAGTVKFYDAKDYTAQIGETKYETLMEALAAANAGDTIKLLADCHEYEEYEGFVIPDSVKAVTIDGAVYNEDGSIKNMYGIKNYVSNYAAGITFKNLDMTVGSGDVSMYFYANATVENVTVDGDFNAYNADVTFKDVRSYCNSDYWDIDESDIILKGNIDFRQYNGKVGGDGYIELEDRSSVDVSEVTSFNGYIDVDLDERCSITGTNKLWTKYSSGSYEYWYMDAVYCIGDTGYDCWNCVEAATFEAETPVTDITVDMVDDDDANILVPAGCKLAINGGQYEQAGTLKVGAATETAAQGVLVINNGIFRTNPQAVAIDGAKADPKTVDCVAEGVSVATYGKNFNKRYVVGAKAIIERIANAEEVTIVKAENDLTQEAVVAAIAAGQAKKAGYKISLSEDLEKELASGEYDVDMTEFVNMPNYKNVVKIGDKYVFLNAAEKAEYDAEYQAASHEMQVCGLKVTGSKTLTMTCDAKNVVYEVNGEAISGDTYETGLTAGQIAKFKVKAFKLVAGKVKVYSPSVTKTVKIKAATPKVTKAKKALKVKVAAVEGIAKYQISVKTKKSGTKVKATLTKAGKKTIKKLKAKKTYYVKVRTIAEDGTKGTWSAAKKIKTK